ncbi:YqhA family protein [Floridanema evergladense]|uniref:YqhA family protein n=1 Tax=Floridaenema evergladense BLCC-F167 TaxID=3153639 RepID=A0ABV4WHX5_9CYAN
MKPLVYYASKSSQIETFRIGNSYLPIDIRDRYENIRILKITTLEQLKAKLLQVIVIALVVSFFKKAITINIQNSTDMLILAISILIVALSGYLLHLQSHNSSEKTSE